MPQVEINETTGIATVGVTEEVAQVTIDDSGDTPIVQITVSATPQVIEVGIIGPQGPQGIQGETGPPGSNALAALTDVNVSSKVNQSVLYYDQSSSKFVANSIHTIITLTDGGNF